MVNTDGDVWDELRSQLAEIASEIENKQSELNDLLQERAELLLAAVDEGMPYRDIGFELNISHVAVQKILDDERPYRSKRQFKKIIEEADEITAADADLGKDAINMMIKHFNDQAPAAERMELLT